MPLDKKQLSRRIITLALYSLPVVFFAVCYFIIITSGEDIAQGANTPPNFINDAIAAFQHSARLSDMFAWSIINIFDYVYSFGIDTIIRILDLLMVFSVFYLSTYIILNRRPRLQLFDALTFNLIFLLVILTSNGPALYGGFSKIHNYLPIALSFLIFIIFYLREFRKQKNPSSLLFKFAMLILGFIFGLTSNVTPIAFLITFTILSILHLYKLRKKHQPLSPTIKNFLHSWQLFSIIGVVTALIIMYTCSDLDDYTTSSIYVSVHDYLPFSEIFQNPLNSIIRIIKHIAYNFFRFLAPLAVASLLPIIYLYQKSKSTLNVKTHKFKYLLKHILLKAKQLRTPNSSDRKILIASCIFMSSYILSLSQIYYPTRLILPAYLCATMTFVWLLRYYLKTFIASQSHKQTVKAQFTTHASNQLLRFIATIALVLTTSVVVIRTYFAIDYVTRISPILQQIKNSDQSTFCVDKSIVTSKNLIYIFLGQENFLEDWAMPQKIYDKTIVYCDT